MSVHYDIRTIASGTVDSKYPTIFPNACVRQMPDSPKISLVFEPTMVEKLEAEQQSCGQRGPCLLAGAVLLTGGIVFYGQMVTPIGLAVIGGLGYAFYQRFSKAAIPAAINRQYEPIDYSREDDEFVRTNASLNSSLFKKLDLAFRLYRLGVLQGKEQLEKEVHRLIEAHRAQGPEGKPSLLAQMDQLVEAGRIAREKVKEEQKKSLAVLIGQSGAGKTTFANSLHGCAMRAIPPEYVRQISADADDYVIIAENGLGPIGHKSGIGSSETFDPQLFPVEDHLVLCDFPGLSDSRGDAVALCNSLAIVDVIGHASRIQGFIFVINYKDALAKKATGFRDDLKAMQLLLNDFELYQNSVLFLVTKAGPKATVEHARNKFCEILSTIVQDASHDDPALQRFCKQIEECKVLDRRLTLCNPLDPSNREALISAIGKLTSLDPKAMHLGLPLNPDVLRKLDALQEEIKKEVGSILKQFRVTFANSWKKKIKDNRVVEGAQKLFRDLHRMAESFLTKDDELSSVSFSLEKLTEDPIYQIDANTVQKLQSGLLNWNKVGQFLAGPKTSLSDSVEPDLQEIAQMIDSLRMDAFIGYMKAVLETYDIQKGVNQRGSFIGNRRRYDDPEGRSVLCEKIDTLLEETKKQNLYGPHLKAALDSCSDLQIRSLFDLLQTNLSNPFLVHPAEKGRIKIEGLADNFALSQVIEKIQSDLGGVREVEIKNFTTLYFDQDLKGKSLSGKTIRLIGSEIDVRKHCVINLYLSDLRPSSLLIHGRFVHGGIVQAQDDDLNDDLVFDEQGPDQPSRFSWSW